MRKKRNFFVIDNIRTPIVWLNTFAKADGEKHYLNIEICSSEFR